MSKEKSQQLLTVPLHTVCIIFAVTLVHLIVIAVVSAPRNTEVKPFPVATTIEEVEAEPVELIQPIPIPERVSEQIPVEVSVEMPVNVVEPPAATLPVRAEIEEPAAVVFDETFVDLPALPRPVPPTPQS